jgi:AcrR family transcriptional regulator
VDRIISLARVSRTTFYRNFPDKREALVAAHAKIFARFLAEIEEACRPQTEWAEKVKAGIGAALRFAAAEPAQAQLLASGFVAADLVWARRVRVSHDELAALLRQGRRLHPAAASLPALTEPALVGAIASILARGLVSDDPRLFAALHAQLTQFALIPYLGLAAAAQAVHPA